MFILLQGSHSPTTAFAKLRFGTLTETGTPTPNPTPVASANEPAEYMQCYSSDTIHQNTSASNSPCDSNPSKSTSLYILNSNSNNSNITDTSRSPSPTSMRPSRPMSLSLTKVDEIASNQPTTRRPLSLGVNVLQDVKVEERPVTKTDELTTSISQATPPTATQSVSVANASVISPDTFKLPEHSTGTSSELVLRDSQCKPKVRPRSVTLSENRRDGQSTPTTPTNSLTSPRTVPDSMDRLFHYASPNKSRSLEDILHVVESMPTAASTGSISSTGSHSSLHGSLEVIKVL